MNWIDCLWPAITGVCLTMAIVHLLGALRGAQRPANLLFSLLGLMMAAYSVAEWRLMRSFLPANYLAWLRWIDVLGAVVGVLLLVFVWVYLGAGRRWLGILSMGVMILSLIPDLGRTPKLVFLEVTAIKAVETIGGTMFPAAEGINNPWNPLYYLGLLLLMVFVTDASIIHWRRGESRRAVVVGGTVVLIYLVAGTQAYLVDEGILRMPYMVSATWLFLLTAMAWELSGDQMKAARLADKLLASEAWLRMTTNAANLGMWDWDVVQDHIEANPTTRGRLGLGESERVNLARVLQSVHPDDRVSFEHALRDAIDRRGELETECRVIAPNGATRWLSVRGRVEQGPNGTPIHLRGISIDTTRRRESEMEVRQLRDTLAHISRATTLSELSVSLAHELNQPLGIILGNAQAAQDLVAGNPHVPGEVGEILSDIVAADRRAAAVIQQMRAMLKRGEPSLAPLCLNVVVKEVLGLIRVDLVDRGITVVSELARNLPRVMGDPVQVQQVVINLLLNAADAMAGKASGTRRLTIVTMHEAGKVRLSVRDEGPGLPAAGEQMFRAFFTTKKSGLGLGLSICRSIIETHQGRLWAENNPGGGAVFRFELAAADTSMDS